MHTTRIRLAWLLSATTATMATTALAQGMAPQAAVVEDAWRQCAATTDNTARLACFDAWAQHQQPLTPPPAAAWQAPAASATSARGSGTSSRAKHRSTRATTPPGNGPVAASARHGPVQTAPSRCSRWVVAKLAAGSGAGQSAIGRKQSRTCPPGAAGATAVHAACAGNRSARACAVDHHAPVGAA